MTPAIAFNERETIDAYSRMKKLSYSQFKKWIAEYGKTAFSMGLEEGSAIGAMWSDEEVFQILRSERIGEERAQRIIEKLLEREGEETEYGESLKQLWGVS